MKVLVTGASGFIGRNLIMRVPDDWSVVATYNKSDGFSSFVAKTCDSSIESMRVNLSEPNSVSKAFANHHFDLVYMLAANTLVPHSVENPLADLMSNVNTTINVLENISASKVVYLSSGAVYDGLFGEIGPKTVLSPSLPYSISKLAAESYVKFYFERRRSIESYVVLRFFGAYGPLEPQRKIYTRVLTALLRGHNSYEIYGDGSNLVDAMYIEDAIRGLLKVSDCTRFNSTVDFCVGAPLTVEDLVLQIAEIMGKPDFKIIKTGIAHEAIRFRASNQDFERLFGYKSDYTLERGILEFAEYLRNHYDSS